MAYLDCIDDDDSRDYVASLPSRQARHQEWRRTQRTPCPVLSWCNGCKRYLPITNFYELKPGSIQGAKTILKEKLHTLCSDCHTNNYKTLSDEQRLLNSARRRAKGKGIEFTLKEEDIVIPDNCPALGLKLKSVQGMTGSDCSPSLDRIDNSKGYTKENVAVISFRANTLKNSATAKELRMIANYVKNRLTSNG